MHNKKYSVVGIGNAIVDILAHIDDDFLHTHNIEKGMMRLIDEDEADRLNSAIDIVDQASGGSAANTIVGLASLGNPVSFIGKVQDDPLGNTFENDLKDCGVHCIANKANKGKPTARCVVLITPDAERTMNTFLGIAGHLGPEDIDEEVVAGSAVTYLEGYLWDRPEAKNAFLKAVEVAHSTNGKTALSLSDSFCVNRHRSDFLNLATKYIDILFANEEEIKALFESISLETAIGQCRYLKGIGVITLGRKGSLIVSNSQVHKIEPKLVDTPVDTTGAGDLYAAGFLHGFVNDYDLASCGRMGSIAAAEVLSHYGARPEVSLLEKINGK